MSEDDDDIDIEEHDLFENPAIRKIFPDLSILKQEIDCYDNDEVPQFIARKSKEDQYIPLFHGNKIILGSKPSKPPKLGYEEFFEKKAKLPGEYVQLHDLGPYLQKSERYCSRCFILFPSKITHEDHKECVHLEPRDSYLIEKSRQPNYRVSKTTAKDQLPDKFLEQIQSTDEVSVNNLPLKTKKRLFLSVTAKRWQCERCNRIFHHSSGYYSHRRADKCVKAWQCEHCDKNFLTAANYYAHQANMCTKRKGRLCERCNKSFSNSIKYHDHCKADNCTKWEEEKDIILSAQKTKWQCDRCNRYFNHSSNLSRHRKDVTCIKAINKEQPSEEHATSKNETPKNDKILHEKKLPVMKTNWQCHQCKKVFFRWNSYYAHRKADKCTKAWQCEKCKTTFTASATYYYHRKANKCTKLKEKNNWQCNRCKKIFLHASNYYRHRKEVKCTKPVITKQSSKKEAFVNKVVQNNVKNKKCSHCNVSFPNEEALIDHMYSLLQSRKSSNAPEVEPTYKNSTSSKETSKNENTHGAISFDKNEPIKPSEIQDQKSYSMISQDKPNVTDNDLLYSTEESVYRCPECSYCFTSAQFCYDHLQTKHNISRPINSLNPSQFDPQCLNCPGHYSTRKSLNAHLHRHHKDLINSDRSSEVKSQSMTQDPGESEIESTLEINELVDAAGQLQESQRSKEILDDTAQSPVEKVIELEHSDSIVTSVVTKFESVNPDVSILKSYVFVLKSTLFKCNKCDIHFVSAKMAIDHIGHMELLINWKCKKCNRIFKKEDEKLHEKQHLLCNDTNDYVVHDFNLGKTSDLSKVLFKCSKCAVHFNEECFSTHSMRCGLEKLDLKYCKWCDILIDQTISKIHESCHVEGNFNDSLVVEAEVLTDPHTTKEHHPQTSLTSLKGTKRKSCSKSSDLPLKKANLILNLCYCDTCKCYLKEIHKHDVHLESRCGHMVKYVCKFCGLVLTSKTYQSHKNLHLMMENLKLQDFNFFDMRSGEKICPPIPRYPSCGNCDVHFASKTAAKAHECNKDVYHTCHICDIKLSELAFKLHMPFHNFHDTSLHPNETVIKDATAAKDLLETRYVRNTDETTININDDAGNTVKKVCEENTKTVNCRTDGNLRTTTTTVSSDSTQKPQQITSIDNQLQLDTMKDIANNNLDYEVSTESLEIKRHDNDFLLFSCKSCEVVMHTYNKVVEHCQWHYGRQEIEITTKICNICNITFDISCYDDHEKLHENPKITMKYLYFDTFYFKCGNDIWIKHLFGGMSKEQIKEIIGDSIYISECRVKMEVVQQGEPHLTVFKCDQCQCYIDSSSLYKHAENLCFKLRKHPCSYCGLPFIASLTRIEHEKIHNGREVTLKSYRIVIFNRQEDKNFNNTLNSQTKYVLYQCRNCCCVIADKCRIKSHTCNNHELEKCMKCGLLFDSSDYESHTLKHKLVPDFVVNNMKVILVGNKSTPNDGDQGVTWTSYKGVMKDYTFYSCLECQTCFQTIRMLLEHVCSFGTTRTNCPECGLYFYSSKIKTHRKLHEIDRDFIKENMQIIMMEPRDLPSKPKAVGDVEVTHPDTSVTSMNKTNVVLENQAEEPSTECLEKLNDRTKRMKKATLVTNIDKLNSAQCEKKTKSIIESSSVDQNIDEHLNSSAEQIANIYKCFCGLHFLDKLSITSHMKVCNLRMKAMRQKCSKCDLKFTPNILFSHLLQHHGNKKVVYKLNIVEPTATMEQTNAITKEITLSYYKCSKCTTHFVEEIAARSHFGLCDGGSSNGKVCDVCNILFHSDSYTGHVGNCQPHDQNNRTVTVISEGSLVSKSGSTSNTTASGKTIYKCKECNIHFLNAKSIQLHISKDNEHFKKVQDICNICGLNFVATTLAQHISIHHKKSNVKPNEFIVKEY